MLGSQRPRVCWVPEHASSTGREAIELCEMAGLALDEWQQFVLVNGLGERLDGRWAAFEVGLNVARQNGKGGILEARELTGLFLLKERLLIHSAHEFATATEARLRMEALIEAAPELSRRVRSVNRSHGSEGFTLKSGQRLQYRTRTKGGGRGFSADFLALDEAMILPGDFHGALLPTLSARPNPQVWYTGSAVDKEVHDHGLVFARIRERGIRGGDPRLAYFEWSAGFETPDAIPPELLTSEDVWAAANPGLGIRIQAEHIAAEYRSLDARKFAVERLGVGDWPSPDGDDAIISLDLWDSLTDGKSKMVDPVCVAFDVSPDRAVTSICAAGARPDGLSHVEVVERRSGTGWLVDRLGEINRAHKPLMIVCDGISPAASLIPELEQAGIAVRKLNGAEHAQACGVFYDRTVQEKVRHLGTAELRAALRGAAKRPLNDAWAWSRKNSGVDISPLVGCTLALWAHQQEGPSVYEGRGILSFTL